MDMNDVILLESAANIGPSQQDNNDRRLALEYLGDFDRALKHRRNLTG
jgi:hypothetical protein